MAVINLVIDSRFRMHGDPTPLEKTSMTGQIRFDPEKTGKRRKEMGRKWSYRK